MKTTKKKKPRPYPSKEIKTLIVAKTDYGVHPPLKVVEDFPYHIALKLDKTTLEGSGKTVLEALRSIKKPIKITTKSVLTVSNGEKKHSRPLTIPLAKRLFYPAAQIYLAKSYELLMK